MLLTYYLLSNFSNCVLWWLLWGKSFRTERDEPCIVLWGAVTSGPVCPRAKEPLQQHEPCGAAGLFLLVCSLWMELFCCSRAEPARMAQYVWHPIWTLKQPLILFRLTSGDSGYHPVMSHSFVKCNEENKLEQLERVWVVICTSNRSWARHLLCVSYRPAWAQFVEQPTGRCFWPEGAVSNSFFQPSLQICLCCSVTKGRAVVHVTLL